MSKIHIYHHNDNDGIVSGATIYSMECRNRKIKLTDYYNNIEDVCLYKVSYDNPLSFKEVEDGDKVYLVDYSFSNKTTVKNAERLFYNKEIEVVWIDHHATSVKVYDIYKGILDDIYNNYAFINTDWCAAVLCFIYMHKGHESNQIGKAELDWYINENVPDFFKYIDSWDRFTHEMENTIQFNYGMTSKNNDIKEYFKDIYGINTLPYMLGAEHYLLEKIFIKNIIKSGKSVSGYIEKENKKKIHSSGFDAKIIKDGKTYEMLCLNSIGGSLMFGDALNDYDICCSFNYNGEKFTYSLYKGTNADVDCGEICSILGAKEEYGNHGGGGHKGAAGFISDVLVFTKDSTLTI